MTMTASAMCVLVTFDFMNQIRFCLIIAAMALSPLRLQGTWSLGIIDSRTRTIALAAASCINSVYGIAGVVPASGFVFAQAASNMRAKAHALEAIRRKIPAAEILKRIANPTFDAAWGKQQYAVVTVAEIESPATFTGNDTPHWLGVRAARGISVQGNTLMAQRCCKRRLTASTAQRGLTIAASRGPQWRR